MGMNRKKVNLELTLSITEETLNALMNYRNQRNLPSLDDAASALLADKLGKTSSPLWTDSEILGFHDGGKKILAALCKEPMSPKEISRETGIMGDALRAHLAHLTRRYKKLKKEYLHLRNENIGKYEVNPKYLETISRLLVD